MEFIDGVHEFIKVVENHKYSGFVCCPCKNCKNEKDYSSSRTIHSHLFSSGFMPNYYVWIIMKKKMTGFLTLQAITVPFLMTLQFNLFRNQSLFNSIYYYFSFQCLFKNGYVDTSLMLIYEM